MTTAPLSGVSTTSPSSTPASRSMPRPDSCTCGLATTIRVRGDSSRATRFRAPASSPLGRTVTPTLATTPSISVTRQVTRSLFRCPNPSRLSRCPERQKFRSTGDRSWPQPLPVICPIPVNARLTRTSCGAARAQQTGSLRARQQLTTRASCSACRCRWAHQALQ